MTCHISDDVLNGFRPCVGILLLNQSGSIFVGQRTDSRQGGWQMPQGGIDQGETAEAAAWREMREEIGTDNAELIYESRHWRSYELPAEIAGKIWGGRFKGQSQRWFGFRFLGQDQDIDIGGHGQVQEFQSWTWLKAERLIDDIVSFKRDVYVSVVDEFRHLWA